MRVGQHRRAGLGVERRERLDVGARAPQHRVRGADHEDAQRRIAIDVVPDARELRDDLRRERVRRWAVDPRDGDAVARLELDRLALFEAGRVGSRVREEALPGLRAKPALRHQAAQDRRRREPLAPLGGRGVELVEQDVEAGLVGARERRRDEARAGHHAEVDVANGRHAVLEHKARLDERLEDEALRELVGIELGLAAGPRLAVLVEALAGLRAELARGDERAHARVDVEAVAVGVAQVLGDMQDGVKPE